MAEFLPKAAFEQYTTSPNFEEYFKRNRIQNHARTANIQNLPDEYGSQILFNKKQVTHKGLPAIDQNAPASHCAKSTPVCVKAVDALNHSNNVNESPSAKLLKGSNKLSITTKNPMEGTNMSIENPPLMQSASKNTPLAYSENHASAVPFQRYSILSREDHLAYMEQYLQNLGKRVLRNKISPHLQRLQHLVGQEQAQFQAFLQTSARANPTLFNFFPKELLSRLKAESLLHVNNIKDIYKEPYTIEQVFNFPHAPLSGKESIMKHIKTLPSQAELPTIRYVSPEENIWLSGKMKNSFNSINDKLPMSEQETLLKVMEEHDAQVALPLKTVLALVNNHPPHFVEEWQIPFSVESTRKGNAVVVINEPLGGNRMNVRTAYRLCGESAIHNSCSSFVKKKIEKLFCKSSHANQDTSNGIQKELTRESNASDERLKKDEKFSESSESAKVATVSTCCRKSEVTWSGNTLFYNIYELDNLRLLVHVNKTDHILCQEGNSGGGNPFLVIPYAKVEMQIEHGFEQFSVSELCCLWWKMFLCQPAQTYCCRVDPKTGNIRHTRFYSMPDLTGPGSPFSPALGNSALCSLLQLISRVPTGKHLLKHDSGSTCVVIYKAVTAECSSMEGMINLGQNIEKAISDIWPVDQNRVDWLPLDPWIPLDRHIWQMHTPCTFPLRPNSESLGGMKRKAEMGTFSKKKKKKKKKK